MTTPFLYIPTFAPVVNGAPVPNGLLFTYEAGTTNPKPTFQDPAGVQPNTNPVQLDITGAATVRLEPGSYHFVLTDSTGTTVMWDQDFYTAPYLTGADIISLLSQDQVGSVLYPTSDAENSLLITPVNRAYPVGTPERYLENTTPGTTDMTVGFQTAMAVLKIAGGTLSYGYGPYLLTASIDCTWGGSGGAPPITVQCTSSGHNQGNGVIANHAGVAVFDCTGNDTIQFVDPCIKTAVPATVFPKTGILLARNSTKATLINRIIRPRIVGYFSVACIYNYGSENSVIDSPYCANYNPAANTAVIIYTANNVSSLTSVVPGRIATGACSCVAHDLIAPALLNRGGTTTSDCVRLEQADSFKSMGGWMSSGSSTTKGRSLIYIDQTTNPSSLGSIHDLTAENNAFPADINILFSTSATTVIPTGWTIENLRSISTTRAIAAVDNKTTADGFRIAHISELTSKGISFPGTVQGSSEFNTGATAVTIGTLSAGTILRGTAANWTITTNNGLTLDSGTTVPTGFGVPTGNAVLANFPGASATLVQCSAAIAEIYTVLLARGYIKP